MKKRVLKITAISGGLVLVGAIYGVMWFANESSMSHPDGRGPVRQLAAVLKLYAVDHDDHLPKLSDPITTLDGLSNYMDTNSTMAFTPESHSVVPDGSLVTSIQFAKTLSLLSLSDIPSPEATPLVWGKTQRRHSTGWVYVVPFTINADFSYHFD